MATACPRNRPPVRGTIAMSGIGDVPFIDHPALSRQEIAKRAKWLYDKLKPYDGSKRTRAFVLHMVKCWSTKYNYDN